MIPSLHRPPFTQEDNWLVAGQHKAKHYLASLSPPEAVGGLDGRDGDDRRGAGVAPAQAWGLGPRGASLGGGPRGAVAGGWG